MVPCWCHLPLTGRSVLTLYPAGSVETPSSTSSARAVIKAGIPPAKSFAPEVSTNPFVSGKAPSSASSSPYCRATVVLPVPGLPVKIALNCLLDRSSPRSLSSSTVSLRSKSRFLTLGMPVRVSSSFITLLSPARSHISRVLSALVSSYFSCVSRAARKSASTWFTQSRTTGESAAYFPCDVKS